MPFGFVLSGVQDPGTDDEALEAPIGAAPAGLPSPHTPGAIGGGPATAAGGPEGGPDGGADGPSCPVGSEKPASAAKPGGGGGGISTGSGGSAATSHAESSLHACSMDSSSLPLATCSLGGKSTNWDSPTSSPPSAALDAAQRHGPGDAVELEELSNPISA